MNNRSEIELDSCHAHEFIYVYIQTRAHGVLYSFLRYFLVSVLGMRWINESAIFISAAVWYSTPDTISVPLTCAPILPFVGRCGFFHTVRSHCAYAFTMPNSFGDLKLIHLPIHTNGRGFACGTLFHDMDESSAELINSNDTVLDCRKAAGIFRLEPPTAVFYACQRWWNGIKWLYMQLISHWCNVWVRKKLTRMQGCAQRKILCPFLSSGQKISITAIHIVISMSCWAHVSHVFDLMYSVGESVQINEFFKHDCCFFPTRLLFHSRPAFRSIDLLSFNTAPSWKSNEQFDLQFSGISSANIIEHWWNIESVTQMRDFLSSTSKVLRISVRTNISNLLQFCCKFYIASCRNSKLTKCCGWNEISYSKCP